MITVDPAAVALWFVASHMLGDYLFQNQWMADGKFLAPQPYEGEHLGERLDRHSKAIIIRSVHVACYTIPFAILALLTLPHTAHTIPNFILSIFIPHWLIDCKRWFKNHPWPAKGLMVDQTLHIVHLALVFTIFYGLVKC